MKPLSLIFYGTDGDAAKVLATKIRKEGGSAQLRHAYAFDGEKEPADRIVTLPCVTEYDAGRIAAAYGDVVAPASGSLPLPPPPSSVDPLANLPADWQTSDYGTLRGIAFAATGRSPENQAQAVQMISAALATRLPAPPVS